MVEEAKGKYVLVINFGGDLERATTSQVEMQPPCLMLKQPDPGCPKCKTRGNAVLATLLDRSGGAVKQIDATQVIESNVYRFESPEDASRWVAGNEHLFDLVLTLDDA